MTREQKLEEALRALRHAGIVRAAELVRLTQPEWLKRSRETLISREAVVEIAMRLRKDCDASTAAPTSQPAEPSSKLEINSGALDLPATEAPAAKPEPCRHGYVSTGFDDDCGACLLEPTWRHCAEPPPPGSIVRRIACYRDDYWGRDAREFAVKAIEGAYVDIGDGGMWFWDSFEVKS